MVFNLNNKSNINKNFSESSSNSILPVNIDVMKEINIDGKINQLHLYCIEFENALFVSIYLNNPRLGSFSLAFPILENIERVSLFSGKNQNQADAISQILSKKTNKLVYCSVNIENMKLELEIFKSLIDDYIMQRTKNINNEKQ